MSEVLWRTDSKRKSYYYYSGQRSVTQKGKVYPGRQVCITQGKTKDRRGTFYLSYTPGHYLNRNPPPFRLTMILVYTVIALLITAFVFLPSTARKLNITTAQDNLAGSILRSLLNVYYEIVAFLNFGEPLYSLDVTKIYVYPLKSCSYLEVKEWEIDEHGFKHDRQYMLAYWDDKKGMYEPFTLRNTPRLSLIKLSYSLEENWFEFVYPVMDEAGTTHGHKSFRLPCEITKEFIDANTMREGDLDTNLWDVHFKTHDVGKAIPDEFKTSMRLNRPGATLLVSSKAKNVKTGHPTKVLKEFRTTNFQDYFPMKFLAQEDIDLLNAKMKEQKFLRTMEPLNFRPNVVVQGLQGNQSLDDWYQFRIETSSGAHNWNVAQKCPRCNIPNVKLEEGAYDKLNAASKTLRTYRMVDVGDKHAHFLGLYSIHHDCGYKIRVGDKVSVLKEKVIPYEGLAP